jgi:very-short-patch-repair endonuclease
VPFEVTAPSVRQRPGIRAHRAALQPRDVRHQLGLRVTSPARTLLDIAPRMSEKALTRAVNDLRRQGYLRLHQLADVVSRFPRNPGSGRLRPFLDAPTGPTRSEFEDAFLAFAERFGLPRPQVNVRIGRYEVDVWFPREQVIVELDGWDFHRSRASFESDRERDAEMLARGLVTIRITWEQLIRHPEQVAERLLQILRARRAA